MFLPVQGYESQRHLTELRLAELVAGQFGWIELWLLKRYASDKSTCK